jgi:hypothetical protein
MTPDPDLLRKSTPLKPTFAKTSVLSGVMAALLERNSAGPRNRSPDGAASLLSARSGGMKGYIVRRLRPILTPVLHRIELRVRSAMEKTGLATNIFEIRTNVATMRQEIEGLKRTCDQILDHLSAKSPPPAVDSAKGDSTTVGAHESGWRGIEQTLASQRPDRKVDLVKIELQGGELEVLQALRHLQRANPEIAVLVRLSENAIERSGKTVDAWLEAIRATGFVACEFDHLNLAVHPIEETCFDKAKPVHIVLVQESSKLLAQRQPDVGQP